MIKKKKKQTPYFLYNPAALESNIKTFKCFQDNGIEVYYAVKSNTHKPLIKTLIKNDFGFDIASIEEIKLVKSLGGKTKNFSFSSPTKLENDMKEASKMGIEYYAFDSEEELRKIMKVVAKPKLIARMAVHNKDTSSQDLSGIFGMSTSYYKEILEKAKKHSWPIYGLTFHVGSQNTLISSWEQALEYMEEMLEISKEFNIEIKHLNIGGGIPVPYDEETKPTSYFVKNICKLLVDFKEKHKLEEVIVEPGRAISASTKTLYTKIINRKDYKDPPILVTDMSMFNGLIEIFEHTEYQIEEYKKRRNVKRRVFKVCGMSCDGYDVIKERCLLPEDIKIGDTLIIKSVGAYTFVYGNFHMKGYPPIYDRK